MVFFESSARVAPTRWEQATLSTPEAPPAGGVPVWLARGLPKQRAPLWFGGLLARAFATRTRALQGTPSVPEARRGQGRAHPEVGRERDGGPERATTRRLRQGATSGRAVCRHEGGCCVWHHTRDTPTQGGRWGLRPGFTSGGGGKGQHPNPETGADQASPTKTPKPLWPATAQRGYWQAKPQQTQSSRQPNATPQAAWWCRQEWEQDGWWQVAHHTTASDRAHQAQACSRGTTPKPPHQGQPPPRGAGGSGCGSLAARRRAKGSTETQTPKQEPTRQNANTDRDPTNPQALAAARQTAPKPPTRLRAGPPFHLLREGREQGALV